jgi:imidazolonepropionase-like amidohydrolase
MTPVVALLLAACSPAQTDDDTVVLANARILTVCGAEIPKGSLIIVKGRIVDLVPAGERGGVQSSNIVDLAGKTIIPGLIDAGCTVGIAGVANEDGQEVAPQIRIVDSLDPRSPDLARARQSGVTAALVEPGNRGVIGGVASVIRTAGPSRAGMIVRAESALKGAIGPWPSQGNYSPRGGAATFFARRPTTRMGVAWEFRKAFLDAKAAREKELRDPATGLLIQALEGKLPLRIAASRITDLETALQIAEELGLAVSFEEAEESWKCAAMLAKRNIPVLLRPAAGIVPPSGIEPVDVRLDAFTLLTRAGVKTALLPTGGPEGLLASVALAVRHGASPSDALRAVTLAPAEILGVADRMGSLEKGKDANLVVVSGAPHDLTTRVEGVMIDGRWVFGEKVRK